MKIAPTVLHDNIAVALINVGTSRRFEFQKRNCR